MTRRESPELLAQVFEGIYVMLMIQWALDFHAPHSLRERLDRALDVFVGGVRPARGRRRERSGRA